MKITSKGQVTIPMQLRDKMGLLPHTEVEFTVFEDELRLVRVASSSRRGKTLVERMKGKSTIKMTTDEIMALTRN